MGDLIGSAEVCGPESFRRFLDAFIDMAEGDNFLVGAATGRDKDGNDLGERGVMLQIENRPETMVVIHTSNVEAVVEFIREVAEDVGGDAPLEVLAEAIEKTMAKIAPKTLN